jgi:hypothetical protein
MIVIIGASPLSIYLGLILKKHSIPFKIIDRRPSLPTSWMTEGTWWPAPLDPPTRIQVAHGPEIKTYLLEFYKKSLKNFRSQIPESFFQEIPCVRRAFEDFEIREMEKCGYKHKNTYGTTIDYKENVGLICTKAQAFQNWIESELKDHMIFNETLQNIEESTSNVMLQYQNTTQKADIVILAGGREAQKFFPHLKNVLASVKNRQDKYHFIGTGLQFENEMVRAYRGASGNWTLSMRYGKSRDDKEINLEDCQSLTTTGPTYFSHNEDKTLHFFKTKFRFFDKYVRVSTRTYQEIWPCDELPLLGEFGHHGRILGSCGWLGTGVTAQYQASLILWDILKTGRSSDLHPLLTPRRFLN